MNTKYSMFNALWNTWAEAAIAFLRLVTWQ